MILGIDEVGRGAWAGPLVVGACVLNNAKIEGLTDSKTLSKKRREELAREIAESQAIVGLGEVSSEEIDRIGLGESLRLATRRAVEKVQAECRKKGVKFSEIIIDGTVNFLVETPLENYVSTMKKADLLISSVSAAAISAKVYRDDLMSELAKSEEFSNYGFENHAGYGTKKHRESLRKFGVSSVHRRSFRPVAEMIESLPSGEVSAKNSPKSFEENKTTKQLGDTAEEKVAEMLQNDLHEIIARNWRTKFCEIDIVSKKGRTFYFTEVKFRKSADFGGGEAAISKKKIEQMRFAAKFFVHENNLENADLRLACSIVEGESFEIRDWFEVY